MRWQGWFCVVFAISITIWVECINGEDLNDSSPSPIVENEWNPVALCPSNVACEVLGGDCIDCNFNASCVYGGPEKAECSSKPDVNCTGRTTFERDYTCRYCYQLEDWDYKCNQSTTCMISSSRSFHPPRSQFTSLCSTKDDVLCLGRRKFYKQRNCNWTSGYKWSTAFILSVTLGGFGVDRFYLGLWREGIGKLFSFGGLGVWTLVDVILVGVGYVGPADGSIYI